MKKCTGSLFILIEIYTETYIFCKYILSISETYIFCKYILKKY